METKNLDTKYCVGLGEILFDVLPTIYNLRNCLYTAYFNRTYEFF